MTSLQPLDEGVDHVRGSAGAPLVLEYGDYECPYSRQAFRAIEHVERRFVGGIRFAFRHFPLTEIHPHALIAAATAEAAALQGRFWEMHELLSMDSSLSSRAICAGMPPSSTSICPASTRIGPTSESLTGSSAT